MKLKVGLVLLLEVLLLFVLTFTLLQEPDSRGPGVVKTSHFTITYDEGIWRSSARHYAEGLEAAYQQLVIKQGFRDGRHEWQWRGRNAIKLSAHQERSIAAHEFFHSIQMLGYSLSLGDRFLLEGTAMWAMREVYPQHVECYIYLLGDWLVGGTDVGKLKLLYPGHQAGLFWNFISDRYGGAQLIRQLFEHPDIRLGVDWPKVLGQLTGKSFLDLWAEFAVALATRQVPDAKWLYPQAERKTPYVPVPVFVGEWTSQTLVIEQSNWENPYPSSSKIKVGSPLTVLHPYGIHFVRLVPKSKSPFVLQFQGDPNTDFRVHLVALKSSGTYEVFFINGECGIARPLNYTLFQVVVTRGEKGSGRYQLSLQKPQTADFSICFPMAASR